MWLWNIDFAKINNGICLDLHSLVNQIQIVLIIFCHWWMLWFRIVLNPSLVCPIYVLSSEILDENPKPKSV